MSGRDVQPTLERARPSCRAFFQAAGSFVSGLALAPGPGPGSASSSLRGASSWRPGHPVAARGSSRRANWRWSHPPRPAHRARTPGRPVRATPRHATCRVRPDSAHFDACRAAPFYAPTVPDVACPPWAAPSSRSELAPKSLSVVYDNDGELTDTTDADGRRTTYSYNDDGDQTGETWLSTPPPGRSHLRMMPTAR